MTPRLLRHVLALGLALVVLLPLSATATTYDRPIEDFASYDPQTRCGKAVKAGTRALTAWIDATYDRGDAVGYVRACSSGGVSEHKEGRAVDWMVRAGNKRDRIAVRTFLTTIFAADGDGNAAALARRMGIMYVIWNDHIWASYNGFVKRDYRPCRPLSRCSATARHRDHVHISLSRAGGKGRTSWYDGRVPVS